MPGFPDQRNELLSAVLRQVRDAVDAQGSAHRDGRFAGAPLALAPEETLGAQQKWLVALTSVRNVRAVVAQLVAPLAAAHNAALGAGARGGESGPSSEAAGESRESGVSAGSRRGSRSPAAAAATYDSEAEDGRFLDAVMPGWEGRETKMSDGEPDLRVREEGLWSPGHPRRPRPDGLSIFLMESVQRVLEQCARLEGGGAAVAALPAWVARVCLDHAAGGNAAAFEACAVLASSSGEHLGVLVEALLGRHTGGSGRVLSLPAGMLGSAGQAWAWSVLDPARREGTVRMLAAIGRQVRADGDHSAESLAGWLCRALSGGDGGSTNEQRRSLAGCLQAILGRVLDERRSSAGQHSWDLMLRAEAEAVAAGRPQDSPLAALWAAWEDVLEGVSGWRRCGTRLRCLAAGVQQRMLCHGLPRHFRNDRWRKRMVNRLTKGCRFGATRAESHRIILHYFSDMDVEWFEATSDRVDVFLYETDALVQALLPAEGSGGEEARLGPHDSEDLIQQCFVALAGLAIGVGLDAIANVLESPRHADVHKCAAMHALAYLLQTRAEDVLFHWIVFSPIIYDALEGVYSRTLGLNGEVKASSAYITYALQCFPVHAQYVGHNQAFEQAGRLVLCDDTMVSTACAGVVLDVTTQLPTTSGRDFCAVSEATREDGDSPGSSDEGEGAALGLDSVLRLLCLMCVRGNDGDATMWTTCLRYVVDVLEVLEQRLNDIADPVEILGEVEPLSRWRLVFAEVEGLALLALAHESTAVWANGEALVDGLRALAQAINRGDQSKRSGELAGTLPLAVSRAWHMAGRHARRPTMRLSFELSSPGQDEGRPGAELDEGATKARGWEVRWAPQLNELLERREELGISFTWAWKWLAAIVKRGWGPSDSANASGWGAAGRQVWHNHTHFLCLTLDAAVQRHVGSMIPSAGPRSRFREDAARVLVDLWGLACSRGKAGEEDPRAAAALASLKCLRPSCHALLIEVVREEAARRLKETTKSSRAKDQSYAALMHTRSFYFHSQTLNLFSALFSTIGPEDYEAGDVAVKNFLSEYVKVIVRCNVRQFFSDSQLGKGHKQKLADALRLDMDDRANVVKILHSCLYLMGETSFGSDYFGERGGSAVATTQGVVAEGDNISGRAAMYGAMVSFLSGVCDCCVPYSLGDSGRQGLSLYVVVCLSQLLRTVAKGKGATGRTPGTSSLAPEGDNEDSEDFHVFSRRHGSRIIRAADILYVHGDDKLRRSVKEMLVVLLTSHSHYWLREFVGRTFSPARENIGTAAFSPASRMDSFANLGARTDSEGGTEGRVPMSLCFFHVILDMCADMGQASAGPLTPANAWWKRREVIVALVHLCMTHLASNERTVHRVAVRLAHMIQSSALSSPPDSFYAQVKLKYGDGVRRMGTASTPTASTYAAGTAADSSRGVVSGTNPNDRHNNDLLNKAESFALAFGHRAAKALPQHTCDIFREALQIRQRVSLGGKSPPAGAFYSVHPVDDLTSDKFIASLSPWAGNFFTVLIKCAIEEQDIGSPDSPPQRMLHDLFNLSALTLFHASGNASASESGAVVDLRARLEPSAGGRQYQTLALWAALLDCESEGAEAKQAAPGLQGRPGTDLVSSSGMGTDEDGYDVDMEELHRVMTSTIVDFLVNMHSQRFVVDEGRVDVGTPAQRSELARVVLCHVGMRENHSLPILSCLVGKLRNYSGHPASAKVAWCDEGSGESKFRVDPVTDIEISSLDLLSALPCPAFGDLDISAVVTVLQNAAFLLAPGPSEASSSVPGIITGLKPSGAADPGSVARRLRDVATNVLRSLLHSIALRQGDYFASCDEALGKIRMMDKGMKDYAYSREVFGHVIEPLRLWQPKLAIAWAAECLHWGKSTLDRAILLSALHMFRDIGTGFLAGPDDDEDNNGGDSPRTLGQTAPMLKELAEIMLAGASLGDVDIVRSVIGIAKDFVGGVRDAVSDPPSISPLGAVKLTSLQGAGGIGGEGTLWGGRARLREVNFDAVLGIAMAGCCFRGRGVFESSLELTALALDTFLLLVRRGMEDAIDPEHEKELLTSVVSSEAGLLIRLHRTRSLWRHCLGQFPLAIPSANGQQPPGVDWDGRFASVVVEILFPGLLDERMHAHTVWVLQLVAIALSPAMGIENDLFAVLLLTYAMEAEQDTESLTFSGNVFRLLDAIGATSLNSIGAAFTRRESGATAAGVAGSTSGNPAMGKQQGSGFLADFCEKFFLNFTSARTKEFCVNYCCRVFFHGGQRWRGASLSLLHAVLHASNRYGWWDDGQISNIARVMLAAEELVEPGMAGGQPGSAKTQRSLSGHGSFKDSGQSSFFANSTGGSSSSSPKAPDPTWVSPKVIGEIRAALIASVPIGEGHRLVRLSQGLRLPGDHEESKWAEAGDDTISSVLKDKPAISARMLKDYVLGEVLAPQRQYLKGLQVQRQQQPWNEWHSLVQIPLDPNLFDPPGTGHEQDASATAVAPSVSKLGVPQSPSQSSRASLSGVYSSPLQELPVGSVGRHKRSSSSASALAGLMGNGMHSLPRPPSTAGLPPRPLGGATTLGVQRQSSRRGLMSAFANAPAQFSDSTGPLSGARRSGSLGGHHDLLPVADEHLLVRNQQQPASYSRRSHGHVRSASASLGMGTGLASSGQDIISGWEPEDFDLAVIPPSRSPQRPTGGARFGTLGGRLGPVGEMFSEVEVQDAADKDKESNGGLTVLFT